MFIIILTLILVILIAYFFHNNFYKTSTDMNRDTFRRSSSLPNNCSSMGNIFKQCFKSQADDSPAYIKSSTLANRSRSQTSRQILPRISSLTDQFGQFGLSSNRDVSFTGNT